MLPYSNNNIQHYDNILKIISNLNIIYYVQYGSSLGAVRNGGLIPNDHDMDLAIPVWKNYHVFKCSYYVSINCKKYNMTNCFLYNGFKICGKNRTQYVNIFKTFLEKYIHGYKIYSIKRSVVIKSDKIKIDMTIYIGNEGNTHDVNICSSTFSGIKILATENAFYYSYLDYGKSFLDIISQEVMPRLYLYSSDGPIYSYEVYVKIKNKSIIIETYNITKAKILANKSETWRIWCKNNYKALLCS